MAEKRLGNLLTTTSTVAAPGSPHATPPLSHLRPSPVVPWGRTIPRPSSLPRWCAPLSWPISLALVIPPIARAQPVVSPARIRFDRTG